MGRTFAPRLSVALVGVSLAALVAGLSCRGGGSTTVAAAAQPSSSGVLRAQIRRTSHGIPNILAGDWGGIGFGYGYAFAQDNICTIAESYVTVDAQRSRYSGSGVEGTFGPSGSYPQRGNGFGAGNLNSDFFYQRIIDNHVVEDLLAKPVSQGGPKPEIRDGVRGYVAGYNKYLADTGVANLPDRRCRGAPWVHPITEIDAYRRFYQLALLASQTVAIDGIGSAQPPAPGDTTSAIDPASLAKQLTGPLGNGPLGAIGSNAVALGSQATSNGKGVMLANPHFPWYGPERFYQAHLTIPGKLNVSGASLFGVPVILIGHTANLAWSHTVSTAYRFTPFEETLVAGSPTTYLYDGVPQQMHKDTVTIKVNNGSSLQDQTRTLYSTRHGPVMSSLVGVPLPWVHGQAFTMGDANAANFRYLNHFFDTDQAQSVAEYDHILKTNQGIPWVNSIAADSAGKAYYADISVVPNVTDQKAQTCNTPAGQATFQALRLPILNGALSACEWGNDPDAAQPGIFGPSHLPSLIRDDYVTNSNDSYWLANPKQPLEGFSRIIGDERTARALRTRLGLRIVQQRLDGSDGLPGKGFDRQALQDAVFNNRQYAGEMWRDQLVGICTSAPGGMLPGANGPVDVSGACPALAAWDLHDNLGSNGAILFRRFTSRALAAVGGQVSDPSVFSTPFNANDPVNTPNGLNTSSPKVKQALADAVTDLKSAGIPLDAPLMGYQYASRGTEKIPIHGGPGVLGVFNAINVSFNNPAAPGYTDVPHGSSFVMVTQFTGGCPDNRSILTYSESANPDSPYFTDQTHMFSNKQWVNPPFCENEVLADPNLTRQTITGCVDPAGCADSGIGTSPGGSQTGAFPLLGRCSHKVTGKLRAGRSAAGRAARCHHGRKHCHHHHGHRAPCHHPRHRP